MYVGIPAEVMYGRIDHLKDNRKTTLMDQVTAYKCLASGPFVRQRAAVRGELEGDI